jgi:hypothetical protein
MKQLIVLRPVAMNKEVMQQLEAKNLIRRMAPGVPVPNAAPGQTVCKPVHCSLEEYGPHKLVHITVNRMELTEFGTHPDNEDFFMIGDTNTKPLYLVIALCLKDELDKKIQQHTLSADDFIALQVKHNDAEVSFFTMLKDVPHGEAIGRGTGKPSSFYVTVGRDLPDADTNMGNFELVIEE